MAVKDYDPRKVTVSIGGINAEGFADGTFISVSRNNQTWTTVSGASGEVSRSKSNDFTGTIELTLLQTSKTNDFLTSKLIADEGPDNAGKFAFALIDANGTTLVGSTECWVQQPPTIEYGKELGDRVWTLEAANLKMTIGGTD
jgi:hypothetical protein